MGAAMILAVCEAPENVGLTVEQAKAALGRCAAELTMEKVEEYWDQFHPGGEDLVEVSYQDRDPGGLEDLAESQDAEPMLGWAQRFIADELISAFEYVTSSRYCTSLYLNSTEWIVAGGASWGDTPEGYDEVMKIDWSGAFVNQAYCGALDLSTAHIPTATWSRSDPSSRQRGISRAFGNIRVVDHEHGWMLFLGDRESDDQAADWAKPVLALARATSCRFINFDSDAEVSSWLEDFTQGGPMEQLANTSRSE